MNKVISQVSEAKNAVITTLRGTGYGVVYMWGALHVTIFSNSLNDPTWWAKTPQRAI